MNSIRTQLTTWILGGLAILWIGAGASIYFAVRSSLLKSLDAELAVDARIVRFAGRGSETESNRPGGRLVERLPSYDDTDGDAFFQFWDTRGTEAERSKSLGEASLTFPGPGVDSDAAFRTEILSDGRRVRTMTFRVAGGGKGKGKSKGRRNSSANIVTLGKETTAIDQTLRSVILGIGLIGVVVAFAAILLVRIGIHRGLRPLRTLARQTGTIDAESLDARFDSTGIPSELLPIYTHLNDLIDRLESSFDRERRFSSDLAHEIRTPVAELKMMNEVALKWPDQGGEKTHRETLAVAEQLESMIETLLTLARCEIGEMVVRQEEIVLPDFFESRWNPFSHKAAERKLSIRQEFGDTDPVFVSDSAMLGHIVTNLLSNAVEYAPEGDEILVERLADGFSISNGAPELDEEDVEKMFDRHWRADQSRSDSSHAGLGLTLASTCAEVIGMRLAARLESGRIRMTLTRQSSGESH